ncbi:MAG: hypothetical protein LBQ87_06225 [Candidatus Fibromonas sp.]|jgi:hypothetical protein|nr:hypothetical protein [Candidatus Fibromonas sp.]
MKLIAAIIPCLFLGTAFSQEIDAAIPDTAALDTTALDTAALDTTILDTMALDTIALDTAMVDTTAIDSTIIEDSDLARIKPGLHFFASVGAQFIDFQERSIFQTLLDTDPRTDSAIVSQKFQTVNLAFPLAAGITWQFNDVHSLSLGAIFLYSNESVILTDKQDVTHNLEYTLQAFPVFAEYRLLISSNFISLREGDNFSLFLRYYWMLPGTEVYSSWGKAKADFDPLGNGFGIFLGYRFWQWMSLSVWGEMGYSSIEVKSGDKNGLLDSWNLGGISLLIRAMF